jgi:steroid 5-alpha reductase family enzyme
MIVGMLHTLFTALLLSVACNVALFLVAYKYKTDRLTDISYALTFIGLILYEFWAGGGAWPRALAVILVGAWAVRLGGFLLFRIWKTKRDKRFDGMRENFVKFGKFWLAQGISVWIILLPAILLMRGSHARFTYICIIGIALWAVGFLLESAADLQKYRFSHNAANKNKWIDEGVWRWSRHPNYFGEMLVWAGIWFVAVPSIAGGWQLGLSLAGPLFIICLLLFVSGLPPLEKGADKRWGTNPAYQAYKKRTSLLIPLPPKK